MKRIITIIIETDSSEDSAEYAHEYRDQLCEWSTEYFALNPHNSETEVNISLAKLISEDSE